MAKRGPYDRLLKPSSRPRAGRSAEAGAHRNAGRGFRCPSTRRPCGSPSAWLNPPRLLRGTPGLVKPVQQPHIPIFFGGSSDAAIDAAGRHADTYALFGETLAQVREQVTRVRAAAANTAAALASACHCVRSSPTPRPPPGSARTTSSNACASLAQRRACRVFQERRAARVRRACCARPRRVSVWTSGCGPAWPKSQARAAIRLRWSAPASKWPTRCSTITSRRKHLPDPRLRSAGGRHSVRT